MNGLYFALRGGREHRNLRHQPSQIQLVEKPGERPCLIYHEDVSKNHPGGLKGRKIKPKVVVHHANIEKPERCSVRLYHKLCPIDVYYLNPLQTPNQNVGIPIEQLDIANWIRLLVGCARQLDYLDTVPITPSEQQQQLDYISQTVLKNKR